MQKKRLHKPARQDGFITMIIVLLTILIAAVVFVVMRVKNAQSL